VRGVFVSDRGRFSATWPEACRSAPVLLRGGFKGAEKAGRGGAGRLVGVLQSGLSATRRGEEAARKNTRYGHSVRAF
jgi:hypothetical protein